MRQAAEVKLKNSEKRCTALEAKLKESDRTLLEKSSRQYVFGFLEAKAQLRILHPNLDYSKFSFMKKIVNGEVVGPADPDVSSLSFMQGSDGEDEDGEEEKQPQDDNPGTTGGGEANKEKEAENV